MKTKMKISHVDVREECLGVDDNYNEAKIRVSNQLPHLMQWLMDKTETCNEAATLLGLALVSMNQMMTASGLSDMPHEDFCRLIYENMLEIEVRATQVKADKEMM